MKTKILIALVLAAMCSLGCVAGTTKLSWVPTDGLAVMIYYSQNSSVTNAQSITNLMALNPQSVDAGTNTSVLISGLSAGTWYFNAASYSGISIGDTTNGISGLMPITGVVNLKISRP